MKTLPYRVILIAVVLYTTCFSLAANFLPSVSLATRVPDSYVTLRGGSGDQPATNLAVMDQSGTDNNWDAYVEFTTPNGSTYSGYQVFTLPSSVPTQNITSLSFKVNFLGPLYSYQIWTWSIYNWGAASWVKLGT
ncbi:MAG TPA: hypothetical protein VFI68_02960, partial [Anaerolineales bacterium]|nr:hypothetical protein [Anaerolineales bacterium]